MRIGIITFHFAYNHGAVLQAWALQKYLQNQGHDVIIIDYRPGYHTERYSVWRQLSASYKVSKSQNRNAFSVIKAIAGTLVDNVRYRERRKNKRLLFESFFKKNYYISKRYETLDSIRNSNEFFDVLIAGSDQIWNKKLTEEKFDNSYFLEFGNKNCKRIIYGTSLGETDVETCVENILSLKYKLDALSCREQKDCELFTNGLNIACEHVPDPTLLIDTTFYAEIEENIDDEGSFVLLYLLKENSMLIKQAANMALKGSKVINISPITLNIKGVINKPILGPGQFLSYIKKSDIVITNSFHGTVFSILYKKRLVCGTNGKRNARMLSFLDAINLKEKVFIENEILIVPTISKEEWEQVFINLTNLSNKGKFFLQDNL